MKSSELQASSAAGSFRDPAGRLFSVEGRLLRQVAPAAAPDLQAFLGSAAARRFREEGKLVASRRLDAGEAEALAARAELEWSAASVLVEHERLPFVSYPYEWPPEMLHAGAELTLELAEALLAEGLGLKDATPYNILFRGPQPVFVDVLSAERRDPGDPTWLACAQFVRTFLLPLLANQRFGLPLDKVFTTSRDGLEPEEIYRLSGMFEKLRPLFFGLVTLPTWLGRRHDPDDTRPYRRQTVSNPEKARFILDSLLRRLRRQLARLAPGAGRSAWSGYGAGPSYSETGFQAKQEFVAGALAEFRPRRVLDVGCNTGHFAELAARQGARVVAMDADSVVVGAAWRRARAGSLDILPLVVNLARPSPAVGWRNRECAAFLDRARNGFDAVLMLAFLHHLLVSERVPLDDIVELAAELTTDLLLIEYVDPADPLFRRLTRGREHLHADLTREAFEAACRRRFSPVRSTRVPEAHRWLYLLRKTEPHAQA